MHRAQAILAHEEQQVIASLKRQLQAAQDGDAAAAYGVDDDDYDGAAADDDVVDVDDAEDRDMDLADTALQHLMQSRHMLLKVNRNKSRRPPLLTHPNVALCQPCPLFTQADDGYRDAWFVLTELSGDEVDFALKWSYANGGTAVRLLMVPARVVLYAPTTHPLTGNVALSQAGFVVLSDIESIAYNSAAAHHGAVSNFCLNIRGDVLRVAARNSGGLLRIEVADPDHAATAEAAEDPLGEYVRHLRVLHALVESSAGVKF